jgi:hypothetical protein
VLIQFIFKKINKEHNPKAKDARRNKIKFETRLLLEISIGL